MNEYICGTRFILKYYISNGAEEYANSHNWGHVDQLGGETMPTQIIQKSKIWLKNQFKHVFSDVRLHSCPITSLGPERLRCHDDKAFR